VVVAVEDVVAATKDRVLVVLAVVVGLEVLVQAQMVLTLLNLTV
jgi:hypothetical protein